MINVLFVCLGNICRSPMAEAMFRHKLKEAGLEDKFTVDSAGTDDWNIGERLHQQSHDILVRNGIDTEGLIARQIQKEDIEKFQYILAMDEDNKKDIEALAGENSQAKIIRLMDLVPEEETKNIPDPYYTGGFEESYVMIEKGLKKLLTYIKKAENIA